MVAKTIPFVSASSSQRVPFQSMLNDDRPIGRDALSSISPAHITFHVISTVFVVKLVVTPAGHGISVSDTEGVFLVVAIVVVVLSVVTISVVVNLFVHIVDETVVFTGKNKCKEKLRRNIINNQ